MGGSTGSRDNAVKKWDVETGLCIQGFIAHFDIVSAVALDPFMHHFISCARDKEDRLKAWDYSTWKCKQAVDEKMGCINAMAISRDGTRIVTGSDWRIHAWKLVTSFDNTGWCPGRMYPGDDHAF